MSRNPRFRLRRWGTALALAANLAAAASGAEPPPGAPVDPAARMRDEGAAGEHWDVTAHLEGGAYLFARFWVTNEGPGLHTGVAMGTFLGPGGERADYKYGRDPARWTLAAEGRFIQIASAVLDLREPDGRVEIDTDKYGLKIFLRFPMVRAPRPICARRGERDGFDVLRLGAEVGGIAWVKGMNDPLTARGTVDVTHGWSSASEIDEVQRRVELSARADDLALYASAVVAPGGERADCIAIARDGAVIFESRAAAEIAAASVAYGESDYPVPARMRFADGQVELEAAPERLLLRVNPLEVVPQPFRAILGLRSQPRRIWSDSAWSLRLGAAAGRPAIAASGRGVTSVIYTNPWPAAR